MAELQARCDSHSKERAALKIILEAKLGTLVADINRSIGEVEPLVCDPLTVQPGLCEKCTKIVGQGCLHRNVPLAFPCTNGFC
jgi:hypothetical protein